MGSVSQDWTSAGSARHMGWREFFDDLNLLDFHCLQGIKQHFVGCLADSIFGDLIIRRVRSQGLQMHAERTPDLISNCQIDLVWICVMLKGGLSLGQIESTAILSAGDVAVVDGCRPYSLDIPVAPTDSLWIGASRQTFSGRVWDMDEILGRRIAGNEGTGAIASRLLCNAFMAPESLVGSAAIRIGHGLMDVVAAAADNCRMQQPASKYRHAVARRIKAYIDAHMNEDTLTVARIANDNRLTVRYLAKLFESETQTVSAWIWNRRLERCHAALLEADGSRKISEIAYGHGFKNLSHFSRAFRRRFGMSPSSVFGGGAGASWVPSDGATEPSRQPPRTDRAH